MTDRIEDGGADLLKAFRLALAALDDYTEWHERGLDVSDPPSLEWSKRLAEKGHAAIARSRQMGLNVGGEA